MKALLARLKTWWTAPRASASGPVPFAVTCACGQTAQGARKAAFQVVRCGQCGQKLFVLPVSPLPSLVADASSHSLVAAVPQDGLQAPVPRRPWRSALLAASITVLLLLAGYGLLRLFWTPGSEGFLGWFWPPEKAHGPSRPAGPGPEGQEPVAARLAAAEEKMGFGNFRLALADLDALQKHLTSTPSRFTAEQRQSVEELREQAAVLADLLAEPLEDLLRHATAVVDREWQVEFERRWQGRSVVFDVELRRLGDGPKGEKRFEHDYLLRAEGVSAHLEFDDLTLLQRLPLEGSQRLVFAARLDRLRREPPRGWVVRFQPDSGVLLTHQPSAVACCGPLHKEAAELLRRQAAWVRKIKSTENR